MADESSSSTPSKVTGLSQSDTTYLATMFVCPKDASKSFDASSVDFDALASILGYKDAGSARTRWHKLSRKLGELGAKNVSGGGVKKVVKREAKNKKVVVVSSTKAKAKARDDDDKVVVYDERIKMEKDVMDENDIVLVRKGVIVEKLEGLKKRKEEWNGEVEEGEYE